MKDPLFRSEKSVQLAHVSQILMANALNNRLHIAAPAFFILLCPHRPRSHQFQVKARQLVRHLFCSLPSFVCHKVHALEHHPDGLNLTMGIEVVPQTLITGLGHPGYQYRQPLYSEGARNGISTALLKSLVRQGHLFCKSNKGRIYFRFPLKESNTAFSKLLLIHGVEQHR